MNPENLPSHFAPNNNRQTSHWIIGVGAGQPDAQGYRPQNDPNIAHYHPNRHVAGALAYRFQAGPPPRGQAQVWENLWPPSIFPEVDRPFRVISGDVPPSSHLLATTTPSRITGVRRPDTGITRLPGTTQTRVPLRTRGFGTGPKVLVSKKTNFLSLQYSSRLTEQEPPALRQQASSSSPPPTLNTALNLSGHSSTPFQAVARNLNAPNSATPPVYPLPPLDDRRCSDTYSCAKPAPANTQAPRWP